MNERIFLYTFGALNALIDMNKFCFSICKLFILICFLTFFGNSYAQNKYALIIAIGDYPKETKWGNISSVKDIPLIENSLKVQGFNNISILKNEEATKEGILLAFSELNKKLKKGDIVCIHFSSHGQQIQDFSGDELDDGLDEAIVPYGAPAYFTEGYKGEKHLLDDEIQVELEKLQLTLGKKGDILLLLDACHSGTAARGGKARGDKSPITTPGFKYKTPLKIEFSLIEKNVKRRGLNSDMAPIVVVSASGAKELNYEYKGNGSLSVAFSRSIKQLKKGETYRSLFSAILNEMNKIAPNQTPAIEGNIDRELFGGKSVVQESFYFVKFKNANMITLDGGKISGLFKDTEIAIYPAGTKSIKEKEPMAIGKITYAENGFAQATLNKKLDKSVVEYWAFVTNQSFDNQIVKISIDRINNRKRKKYFKKLLLTIPSVQLDSENPDFFLLENEDETLNLLRVKGESMYKANIKTTDNLKEFKTILNHYIQGQFLLDLNLSDSRLNIEVELIPVLIKNKQVVKNIDIQSKFKNGVLTFKTGDYAQLKITNTGTEDVYYTILDIQPDGIINPVVPNPYKNEPASSFRIKVGESYLLKNKYLRFAPPYGTETYKIFISKKPLNLAPLVMSKGAGSRGSLNTQLEKIFKDSYSNTRGTAVESVDMNAEITTKTLMFKIKK